MPVKFVQAFRALSLSHMSLLNDIEDVRSALRAGSYRNEAAVSQGVVLRLLAALGWPTFDTQVVCPEFSLSGRRVDYALCHPANKAAAFVEVKQIGQADGAERQLFEYAFHQGVPLAILTDGQEWNFFLPGEQGDYSERRVYKLDILERELAECVARLERYLSYAHVSSGESIAWAREDYRDASRTRQIHATFPAAWAKLMDEEDDLLLELLADKVESLCGYKPDLDAVAKYLRKNVPIPGHTVPSSASNKSPAKATTVASGATGSSAKLSQPVPHNAVGFSVDGRFVPCRNGREVLVGVFEALAERDPSFLERFAARPKHGRTRRYLAKTPAELYPGRPDLAQEFFGKLKSGWYVGTNVSHAAIERIAEMACEVARLRFGRDVVVYTGE